MCCLGKLNHNADKLSPGILSQNLCSRFFTLVWRYDIFFPLISIYDLIFNRKLDSIKVSFIVWEPSSPIITTWETGVQLLRHKSTIPTSEERNSTRSARRKWRGASERLEIKESNEGCKIFTASTSALLFAWVIPRLAVRESLFPLRFASSSPLTRRYSR